MVKRIFYLAEVYLLTVVIFVLAKLAFMCYHAGSQSFGLADVLDVIRHSPANQLIVQSSDG